MKKTVRLVLSLVFYCMTGIGISFTIKAEIGVSSFNSLNVALANVLHSKVGMVTAILNGLFLVSYMLLTKMKHPVRYFMQAVAVVCLGSVIDFFTYEAFGDLRVSGYFVQLLVFVLGTTIAGISTGMVLNLQSMVFPIEGACTKLAERMGAPFSRVRYGVDVLSVSGSLLLSLLFGLPLLVREGTVISLFLLTAAINLTKKTFEKACSNKAKRQESQMPEE